MKKIPLTVKYVGTTMSDQNKQPEQTKAAEPDVTLLAEVIIPLTPPDVVEAKVQQQQQNNKQNKPVVKETRVEAPVPDFEMRIAELRHKGTSHEVALIAAMDSYIDAMKPGVPMTGSAGVTNQYKLWTALFRVIEESPATEFSKLWNIVIGYFKLHKEGVFNIRYVYRFTEFWTRSDDDLHAFKQIINITLASVTDRSNLNKLVDIHKTVSKKFTEVGRGRLIQFYN